MIRTSPAMPSASSASRTALSCRTRRATRTGHRPSMRTLLLILALTLSATASAEARKLPLNEAVPLAMRVDPMVAEAHITEQRSQLAVLRAQLDRFQLKIDGQLQELWDRGNIGGPTAYNCTIFGYTTTATKSGCTANMGTL